MTQEPGNAGAPPHIGSSQATLLLQAISCGRREAAAELLPLVYEELRRLAAARMAHLPPGQTLQPTALVHDAYLKLVNNPDATWEGRRHFFGAAARAMRDILVDRARAKASIKHGGQARRQVMHDDMAVQPEFDLPTDEIIAIDGALDRLMAEYPRQGEVVLLRYFAGLTEEQTANVLDLTVRTVARDWRFARAWLRDRLSGEHGAAHDG